MKTNGFWNWWKNSPDTCCAFIRRVFSYLLEEGCGNQFVYGESSPNRFMACPISFIPWIHCNFIMQRSGRESEEEAGWLVPCCTAVEDRIWRGWSAAGGSMECHRWLLCWQTEMVGGLFDFTVFMLTDLL